MRRAGAIVCVCVVLGCGAEAGKSQPADVEATTNDSTVAMDVTSEASDGATTLPDGRSCPALDLQPADATSYINTSTTPPTAGTETYTAILERCDGTDEDVSSEVSCTISNVSLGSFSGNHFTSVVPLPGAAVDGLGAYIDDVRCCAGSVCGDARLTLFQAPLHGGDPIFFFFQPYSAPPNPTHHIVKFGTNIKQTDVAISVDTSGSNAPALASLKKDLVATMLPGITAAIPSVGVGLATHEDYPLDGYGTSGCDLPARIELAMTTDVAKMSTAVAALSSNCGGDEPESQLASLFYVATGKELDWLGRLVPAATPAPGTSGGMGFRAGSLDLFVEISDAHMHDAVVSPYGADVTAPPSTSDVEGAIEALHGRFVGVFDVHHTSDESQYDALCDATGSAIDPAAFGTTGTCPTGAGGADRAADGPGAKCRLVFQTLAGAGVADSIVKAVQGLSIGSVFDVTAIASNDPANPLDASGKPIDATKFIKVLRAIDAGSPSDGCPPHAAIDTDCDGIKDTFVGVNVGTPVCFEVDAHTNSTVPTPPTPLALDAFIDVVGMPGAVKLDRRSMPFLVPSK
jgi:hypothetical protein